jgi:hypothetical protein
MTIFGFVPPVGALMAFDPNPSHYCLQRDIHRYHFFFDEKETAPIPVASTTTNWKEL